MDAGLSKRTRKRIAARRVAKQKKKRKLTAAEKAAKRQKRKEYQTVFIGGKMKRVRRPPTIDGMSVGEFIRRNADPIWLHQEGLWEYLEAHEAADAGEGTDPDDSDLPF
jgi:uncharacterized protein YnzC (UPF0291/DUF896 family)